MSSSKRLLFCEWTRERTKAKAVSPTAAKRKSHAVPTILLPLSLWGSRSPSYLTSHLLPSQPLPTISSQSFIRRLSVSGYRKVHVHGVQSRQTKPGQARPTPPQTPLHGSGREKRPAAACRKRCLKGWRLDASINPSSSVFMPWTPALPTQNPTSPSISQAPVTPDAWSGSPVWSDWHYASIRGELTAGKWWTKFAGSTIGQRLAALPEASWMKANASGEATGMLQG